MTSAWKNIRGNERIKIIKNLIQKIRELLNRKKSKDTEYELETGRKENPYLPRFRMILEQILDKYGMNYKNFHPLLIDTDTPPESMLDIDDVELVLEQISKDLNFLKIETERTEYFRAYIERMYEDTGLIVQIEEKGEVSLDGINVVIDMEQKGNCNKKYIKEHIRYIPIYKKPWSEVKMLQNVDISVPIGYNTVIVKERY